MKHDGTSIVRPENDWSSAVYLLRVTHRYRSRPSARLAPANTHVKNDAAGGTKLPIIDYVVKSWQALPSLKSVSKVDGVSFRLPSFLGRSIHRPFGLRRRAAVMSCDRLPNTSRSVASST